MLNLSNVFETKNNLLTGLFTDYDYLKFIAINEDTLAKEYIKTITTGFWYKRRKNPYPADITEKITISTFDNDVEIMDKATEYEVGNSLTGEFKRISLHQKEYPKSPSMQWRILGTRNDASVVEIDDAV